MNEDTEHKHKEHHVPKKTKSEETITLTKSSILKGLVVILGILLVFSIYTGGFGYGTNSAPAPPIAVAPSAPSAVPSAPSPALDMKALADDDAIRGSKDAPVTIVEWSDYECPFCKRFYSQTLAKLKAEYIDTGKVKFVYRDFPLSFHDPLSTKESIAAECAREEGGDEMYFKYHDETFKRTNSNGNGMPISELYTIASDLGLNKNKFKSCLDSDKYKAEVQKDIQDGAAAGIQGTPGFIIGPSDGKGILVSGAQPFGVFKQVIDTLLKG